MMNANLKRAGPVVIIFSLAAGFHFFPVLFKKPELKKPTTLTELAEKRPKQE
jgi:hypothetical protein